MPILSVKPLDSLDRLLELVMGMSDQAREILLKEWEERLLAEKRAYKRRPLFIALDYSIQGRTYRDFTQNISATGLFIETRMFVPTCMPFSVGEEVSMTFSLPGRGDSVRVFGEIVRISAQGIGLKFKLTASGETKLTLSGLKTIHETFLETSGDLLHMAKIRKKKVKWNPSFSPDVTGYKLYWQIGKGVDFDSDCAEVGSMTEVILPDQIPSFPLVAAEVEIGITAVNRMGNESDMVKFSAPFNFAAPDAPTNLTVEDL